MSETPQSDQSIRLLIVMVNYRTPELAINSLRSVASEKQTIPNLQAVVANSPSGDDSVAQISQAIAAEGWQDWASLMPLERNGGYAFGNNAVIRPALTSSQPPDYIYLLNPDTLVRPGAIKGLLDFMQAHLEVGIAGTGLENIEGVPRCTAFRFPTLWSELDRGLALGIVSKLLSNWIATRPDMPQEPCQTDWLPGASMMIRRQVFDDIGLMDEGYFLYFEETDFCFKARKAGWACWYVPHLRVVHFPGSSTGVTTPGATKPLPTYWFESRQRYFLNNYGWLYTALTDATWAIAFSLFQIRRTIQRKPYTNPENLLRDFLVNSVLLRGILKPNLKGER